jgi:hypothetical protein
LWAVDFVSRCNLLSLQLGATFPGSSSPPRELILTAAPTPQQDSSSQHRTDTPCWPHPFIFEGASLDAICVGCLSLLPPPGYWSVSSIIFSLANAPTYSNAFLLYVKPASSSFVKYPR